MSFILYTSITHSIPYEMNKFDFLTPNIVGILASKLGSPEGTEREGKESLVHTDCACVKLYQDFWYIIYFPYISSVTTRKEAARKAFMAGDLVMGEAIKGEGFSSSLVYALIKIAKCVWNYCTVKLEKISTGGDNFFTTI